MNDVKRRLEKLQTVIDAEFAKSAFVELNYQDGKQERRKFLPLFFEVYTAYTNGGEPLPGVVDIQYLFDTQRQGVLTQLLTHMLTLSA